MCVLALRCFSGTRLPRTPNTFAGGVGGRRDRVLEQAGLLVAPVCTKAFGMLSGS